MFPLEGDTERTVTFARFGAGKLREGQDPAPMPCHAADWPEVPVPEAIPFLAQLLSVPIP